MHLWRTLVAASLGAVLGAGAAFLADLVALVSRPLRHGLPDLPLRVAEVGFLDSITLAAVATGAIVAIAVASAWMSGLDRPGLRRFIGVLCAAGALAALAVVLLQERAAPGADSTLALVGLSATILAGLFLALVERQPFGPGVPGALGVLGTSLALAAVLWIGQRPLLDVRLALSPPPLPAFQAALVAATPRPDGAARPGASGATASEEAMVDGALYDLDRADALAFAAGDVIAIRRAGTPEAPALDVRLRPARAAEVAQRAATRRARPDVLVVDGKPVALAPQRRVPLDATIRLSGTLTAIDAAERALRAPR